MDPPTLVNSVPATIEARSGFGVSSGPMRPVPDNDPSAERSPGAGNTKLSGLDHDRVKIPGAGNDRDFHPDHSYPPENANGHTTTVAQQASTMPRDGDEVHRMDGTGRGSHSNPIPFKERVVGVAQKTRGTLLGKPDLKEHGEAILEGRTTHAQDKNL